MTQTSGAHLSSKSHEHLPLPRELKAEQLALNYFCTSASLRSSGSPEPVLITFTDLHFGMVPSPLLHEDLRPGKSPT